MQSTEKLVKTGARVAAHAQLQEIFTQHLEAHLDRQPSQGVMLSYEWDSSLTFGRVPESSALLVRGEYDLSIYEAPEGNRHNGKNEHAPEDAALVGTIKFVLASLYQLHLPEEDNPPFTDDELEAFAETTAQFAMYPFARELVRDLTSRLSLPPLTLPMLKTTLQEAPAEAVEGKD